MGFFMRPVPSGVTKPTLESGLTLVTANGDIDFDIVNNDVSNPAAVDLAFTTPAIQAAAFDQGTAQSPSYVLEAGTTRTISLLRDYGAEDYGDGNVTESVNARLPDGTLASQTLTVEPFIEVTGANSFGTFNGSSDYLSTPYNAAFNFNYNSAFTVALWVKTSMGSGGTLVTNRERSSGDNRGWFIYKSVNDWWIWFLVSDASSQIIVASDAVVINDGNWHHIAATYPGGTPSAANVILYQDGNVAAHRGSDTDTLGSDDTRSNGPMQIGGDIDAANKFDGDVDDVGIWNVALDSTQTTVDVDSASGQAVLSVASTTGFMGGDTVCVDPDGDSGIENKIILSVQAGVSITLTTNLANTHTAADASRVINTTNITKLASKTRCHKVQRAALVAYYDFDYVSGSLAGGIDDRTTNDFDMTLV